MVHSVSRTGLFRREVANNSDNVYPSTSTNAAAHNSLDNEAEVINHELYKAKTKTSELSQLAKKRGIYVENNDAIDELTSQIKDGLTVASDAIDTLELNTQRTKNINKQTKLHYNNLVALLRKEVVDITKNLKDILHARANLIVEQESRRKLYSHDDVTKANTGLNHYNRKRFVLQQEIENVQNVDIESGVQLRPAKTVIQDAKAEALANVQRAIGDLTQIFQKVTTLVTQQDEMIQRIDADVDLSFSNVKSAQDELRRYLNRIKNSRTLVFQIFAIIVVFIIVYILFFA